MDDFPFCLDFLWMKYKLLSSETKKGLMKIKPFSLIKLWPVRGYKAQTVRSYIAAADFRCFVYLSQTNY